MDKTGLGYFLWKSVYQKKLMMPLIKWKMERNFPSFIQMLVICFMKTLIPFVEEVIEEDPCLLIVGNSINKEWTRRDKNTVFFYWIVMKIILDYLENSRPT